MRFDKKGISAIVTTVLIVLITVAAVTIIWVAIIPMIQDRLDIQDFDVRLNVETASGYTVYDADKGKLLVRVGRGDDESEIDKLRVIVSFNGTTYSEIVDAPETNQYKTYAFDIAGYVSSYGDPIKVKVAPLILKSGSIKEGMSSSDVEILEGNIVDVDSYDWDYFGEGDCVLGGTQNCGTDTGVCEYGSQTCIEYGGITIWGACTGGTGPATEICDGLFDEDCDTIKDNGCSCVNEETLDCGPDNEEGECVFGV